MPKAIQRETQVGTITAAIILGILAIAFLRPSSPEADSSQGLSLTAEFGRIDGLGVDSPVRMAGIDVGSVVHVTLTERQRARITMMISDTNILIPSDTAAVIETDGVFGEKYIELHPGGEFETLSSGDSISYSQDSVVLESLLNQIVARAKAAADQNNPTTSERPTP